MVKRRVALRLVSWTVIKSAGIFWCPIIHLMGIPGLRRSPSRNHEVPSYPDVALSYALYEESPIESFIIEVGTKTILLAWRGVSDDLAVSRVFYCPFSHIDYPIAIHVNKFHVAGAVLERCRFVISLRRYAFFEGI